MKIQIIRWKCFKSPTTKTRKFQKLWSNMTSRRQASFILSYQSDFHRVLNIISFKLLNYYLNYYLLNDYYFLMIIFMINALNINSKYKSINFFMIVVKYFLLFFYKQALLVMKLNLLLSSSNITPSYLD